MIRRIFVNFFFKTDQLCNVDGSLKNDGSACTIGKACPYDYDEMCTCAEGYTGEKCDFKETGIF